MYVDSHAHIEMESFDGDREEVIARARQAGVELILNIGSAEPSLRSASRALEIAAGHDMVLAAVGVHPHDAKLADESLLAQLFELSHREKVVAWGEIGLDYYYDNSPREKQMEVFAAQLRLARKRGLPVIIHTRQAEQETADILSRDWVGSGLGGVIHCFTGSQEFAERCLEFGFYISFSGILTFKKADEIRKVAKLVPAERILIETDSTIIAPVPWRGRRNEPAFVREVARELARLRGCTPEEMARQTSANFLKLIGR